MSDNSSFNSEASFDELEEEDETKSLTEKEKEKDKEGLQEKKEVQNINLRKHYAFIISSILLDTNLWHFNTKNLIEYVYFKYTIF